MESINEQLPDYLRAFDDVDKTREMIYNNALDSLKKRFPLSDGTHRLELDKVRYSGPQHYSLAQQKRALMTNRSLKTPVNGRWRLVDEATNKVLDEKDDVVMHIPYYTQRGTFVDNGNDYTIANQSRMKPGVYTRTRGSGQHEAHFNVRSGTGPGFRIWMEPETGLFKVNIGQSNVPVYPFFKAAGISDEEMRKSWGDEIFQTNVAKVDNNALNKLYSKIAGYKGDPDLDAAGKAKFIREALPKAELDPWSVERTLGIPGATGITPAVLMRSTQKLLNISRGDEKEDDRDAPKFNNVLSIEDFVKERIDKDAGHTAKQLLWKVKRDKTLKRVGRGALNPYMRTLLMGSGLASPLEETNPMNITDQLHRVIKLGEGGIASARGVTDEARDVNPGQTGFIDLVAGPESDKIGLDVRTAFRTYKGKDQQVYAEFKDNRGKKVYLKPEDLDGKVLAFPGQDDNATKYALKDGSVQEVSEKEIDYTIPSMSHMFNPTVNMTPMSTGFMPSREFYAAKYWSQFMPMVKGETPLVSVKMPDSDMTFNEKYGRKAATLSAPVDGIVTRVTKQNVTVTSKDGKKHVVEMAEDFPFNRMTAITYRPNIKSGQVVKKGDMVANSNFTDAKSGAFNMGINLKTAVVPYKGHSFEDAYVISKSAAEKMATQRLYGIDKDQRNGVKISRKKFVSAFPSKYDKDQLGKLDDFGVIKPGMKLEKGDPIILATGPKLLSAEDAELGNLHKVLRNSFRDESVTWKYNEPGIVTDVAMTSKGAKVNVKTEGISRVGDKLTNQFASKGVIAKIIDDDKMPFDQKTGERYDMLLNPMVVLSRVAPNQLLEMQLAKIAKMTGRPYRLPVEPPKEGWAEFTKNELIRNGLKGAADVYDPETGKTIQSLGDGYTYMHAFHHLAEKKLCLTDDTEVETADGWKLIGDITAEDQVKTLNPITGEEEWQHPTAINKYNVRGEELVHVIDDDQDLIGTMHHDFYLREVALQTTTMNDVRLNGQTLLTILG